jgi:hypothetical protein
MTAGSHTLYSATLFLALTFLLSWANRRHRLARTYRQSLLSFLKGRD